jgi:hypothetical protein
LLCGESDESQNNGKRYSRSIIDLAGSSPVMANTR